MQTSVEAQVRVHAGVGVLRQAPPPKKKMANRGRVEEGCRHPSETRPQSRSQSEAETPRHHAAVCPCCRACKGFSFSAARANRWFVGDGFVGVCASLLALLLWLFYLDHVIDAQNGNGSLGGKRDGLALAHCWLDHACREAVVDGARPAPDFFVKSYKSRMCAEETPEREGERQRAGEGEGGKMEERNTRPLPEVAFPTLREKRRVKEKE